MLNSFAVSVISRDEGEPNPQHMLFLVEAASQDHAEAQAMTQVIAAGCELIGLLSVPAGRLAH